MEPFLAVLVGAIYALVFLPIVWFPFRAFGRYRSKMLLATALSGSVLVAILTNRWLAQHGEWTLGWAVVNAATSWAVTQLAIRLHVASRQGMR